MPAPEEGCLPSAGLLGWEDSEQRLGVPDMSPSHQRTFYWCGEREARGWGSDPAASSTPARLTTAHSRKALRNSRIVSQKDDVHVCIMCLRAIMNYQVSRWDGVGASGGWHVPMVTLPGTLPGKPGVLRLISFEGKPSVL